VGGGTRLQSSAPSSTTGASPRGRRNHGGLWRQQRPVRRISAWAEEPSRGRRCVGLGWAHLRVGGGTERMRPARVAKPGASPRGRRNLRFRVRPRGKARRISAWAEEPRQPPSSRWQTGAHLRVGGGTAGPFDAVGGLYGASPRGRRNLLAYRADVTGERRISAWAEEPGRRGDRSIR